MKGMKTRTKVLAVDDEEFNLDILETMLEDAGYEVIRAANGKEALRSIASIDNLELIVLDRMMPGMDGIGVLKALKTNPKYHNIPVIMQTADGHHEHVTEGIQAGAYYYLIKPFTENVLLSIVKAAIRDAGKLKQMSEDIRKHKNITGLLEKAQFRFRTFEEAASIAQYVANFCPSPEKTAYGLNELMVNAIEHGNLSVPYETKYQLTVEGRWHEEIKRLMSLPENTTKHALLTFECNGDEITIAIKDQGKGFRWQDYLDFDPTRMTEPTGRGIAMSNSICFSSLEYRDGGSQVVCRIELH
jgi:CheY-like chemotaxis protein